MTGRKRRKKEKGPGKAREKTEGQEPFFDKQTQKFLFICIVVSAIIVVIAAPLTVLHFLDRDDDGIYYGDGPDINGQDPDDDILPDDVENGGSLPFHKTGAGSSDWWIDYPDQHPSSGSIVAHPECSMDPLESKPVVIFAHSEGCAPCVQQGKDLATVLDEVGRDKVVFLDMLSGVDDCINSVFSSYDPNAAQSYIPLTVIVTLIEDDSGVVRIAWHSNEGATGEEWLRQYIGDAVYYYGQNSAEW